MSKKFSLSLNKCEATSDGTQRIRTITPSAILQNYSPLYFLVWKLFSLHNSETVQGIFMKHGTNLKHGQKICKEQES